MKPVLRVGFCDHRAAVFATRRWHYSQSMPAGKTFKVGAWEDDRFIGVVVFARGANIHIGSPWGLPQTACVELARVALGQHAAPTSKVVAMAVRLLRRECPGLRLIVSYADRDRGHVGTIYQAMGWTYVGKSQEGACKDFLVHGKFVHMKTAADWHRGKKLRGADQLTWIRENVDPNATRFKTLGRLKYVLPLDKDMRRRLDSERKPYPKRAKHRGDAAGDQPEESGSTPTRTLQRLDRLLE